MNKIATKSALGTRGIQLNNYLCPQCGDQEEDAEHLVVSYGIADMIWSYVLS